VEIEALRQVFIRVLLLSPVTIITTMLHIQQLLYRQSYTFLATDSVVKQDALKGRLSLSPSLSLCPICRIFLQPTY